MNSEQAGHNDISIVLGGEAGQGIQTIEAILTRILKEHGFHIFATGELMSRIRGGSNSTEIRVGGARPRAFVNRIDLFIALAKGAAGHVGGRLTDQTVIIGEDSTDRGRSSAVPFRKIAGEIGSPLFANSIAVGVVCGIMRLPRAGLDGHIRKYFAAKGDDVIGKNLAATSRGYDIGLGLSDSFSLGAGLKAASGLDQEILMNGSEAVALGAIAGGCNFIAAYPMTPSSGVWTFLAQSAREFGIISEQAEDEISAMNMAIGAWYAGGRALVTTSGGGFDLMTEGLSLIGAQESPMVIHLAQRPGPATGLPTRTEQGDLELALHAGHGEFPRVILAPGRIEDGLYLTHHAFNLADRYQVPVFVLTDQYFVESYYNLAAPDTAKLEAENHVVKTDAGYGRYRFTPDGVSPRGVPGYGDGLVIGDCHVHDEAGHISEDFAMRTMMVDKVMKKLNRLNQETLAPEFYGAEDYKYLVVSWGSNYHSVQEAIDLLGRNDLAMLHCRQLYPVPADVRKHLARAQKTVVIENNATGQYANLITRETGHRFTERILKYSGLPFAVEEICDGLKRLVGA